MSPLDDRSIHYAEDGDMMVVRPEGSVDADRLIDLNTRLLDHPSFRPGMSVLWDLREADISSVSREDLYTIKDLAQLHAARRGRGRTALLAGHDLPFAMARMYEQMRDLDHVSVATFRSEEAARRWLAGEGTEGGD